MNANYRQTNIDNLAKSRTLCVITFAGDFTDKESTTGQKGTIPEAKRF
jgi:hypothetical protein